MDYEKEINILNQKIDFMNRRIYRATEQRINEFLNEQGFKDMIYEITKNHVKNNTEEMIKYVVREVLNRLNKKINYELKATKSLCYSIDTEIKHTIRSLDTSYEMDKSVEAILRKNIEELSNNLIKNSLLLEVKNG